MQVGWMDGWLAGMFVSTSIQPQNVIKLSCSYSNYCHASGYYYGTIICLCHPASHVCSYRLLRYTTTILRRIINTFLKFNQILGLNVHVHKEIKESEEMCSLHRTDLYRKQNHFACFYYLDDRFHYFFIIRSLMHFN